MNLVGFFSFSLVVTIITASPVPPNPRSLGVDHTKYQSPNLDSVLLRRAPQGSFELTEILNQDDNLQNADSIQYPDNYPEEFSVAEGTKTKPKPGQAGSSGASDDSEIPITPTRVFNPHKAGDYNIELEHNPGQGEKAPEEEISIYDRYESLVSQMNAQQKTLIQTLKSMNIPKDQFLDAAKKAAAAIGGTALVAWLVANWSVISIGILAF